MGKNSLDALQREYSESLPDKRAQLERVMANPSEALRLVHQLKGSSGAYGFSAISAACQRVEDAFAKTANIAESASALFAAMDSPIVDDETHLS